MVVTITSTGGVAKRVLPFDAPVDPGLVTWAAAYLNERLTGLGLGSRMLHTRLADPSLGATEQRFLEAIAPAFTELADTAEEALYVGGAGRLLGEHRVQDLTQINDLMGELERRVAILGVLRAALGERDVLVRIGTENELPALRSLALVAAGYGLPARKLGHRLRRSARGGWTTPSSSGRCAPPPTSCRASSATSTRADDGEHRTARPLRGPRRRPRRRRRDDQEGLPAPGARAASGRQQPRPRSGGEVQGGRRGLRDPLRRRAALRLRPLRPRGAAHGRDGPELRGLRLDQRPLRRVLRRRLRRRLADRPGAGRRRRRRRRGHARAGRDGRVGRPVLRGDRHLRALPRQRRRAGHADRDLPALRRQRRAAGGVALALRAGRPPGGLRRLRRRRQGRQGAVRALRGPRPRGRRRHLRRRRAGRHRRRPAHPPGRPRPRRRARRPARRPLRPRLGPGGRALPARRRRPRDRPRRPRAHGRARRDARGPDAGRPGRGRGARGHAARRGPHAARARHARAAPARAGAATCRSSSTS